MKIKDYFIPVAVLVCVLLVGNVVFDRCCGIDGEDDAVESIVTVRSDTVYIRDTVRIVKPVPADVTALGTVRVRLPLWRPPAKTEPPDSSPVCQGSENIDKGGLGIDLHHDSVDVAVHVEQRHYGDTLYDAWISGYLPQLDSIHIYSPLRSVTTVRTVESVRWRNRRWGISAGAGVVASSGGVRPGIFVGITYSIWNF